MRSSSFDILPAKLKHATVRVTKPLWTYLPYGPYSDPTVFKASIAAKAHSTDAVYFAILDNSTGDAVGHQAFHRIDPAHRVIEIGHILYTPGMQRTIGATEAQYLFAAYVFDTLGYRRYEWRCDDLNAPSKHAAVRFGFTFEGVFRQHMIVKGRNRNTAWFAMLDSEWPARRAAFERWLDPSNFDAAGCQKVRLMSLHGG
jgi:RimJ/RimL family protein N-acetyltransferase